MKFVKMSIKKIILKNINDIPKTKRTNTFIIERKYLNRKKKKRKCVKSKRKKKNVIVVMGKV